MSERATTGNRHYATQAKCKCRASRAVMVGNAGDVEKVTGLMRTAVTNNRYPARFG